MSKRKKTFFSFLFFDNNETNVSPGVRPQGSDFSKLNQFHFVKNKMLCKMMFHTVLQHKLWILPIWLECRQFPAISVNIHTTVVGINDTPLFLVLFDVVVVDGGGGDGVHVVQHYFYKYYFFSFIFIIDRWSMCKFIW